MSPWKIGGGIAGASLLALGLVAVAHHARAEDPPAATDAAQMDPAQLHAQLTSLFTLVYQHADFDAVETHLTTLVRENPEAFGGDTEAFAVHVTRFMDQIQAHAASDPAGAAEFTANMLIQAHQPPH